MFRRENVSSRIHANPTPAPSHQRLTFLARSKDPIVPPHLNVLYRARQHSNLEIPVVAGLPTLAKFNLIAVYFPHFIRDFISCSYIHWGCQL